MVDFYAPWCGPCQTFAVEFELAAKQLDGHAKRIKFSKVNCEQFPRTCQIAAIQAYPSVRFYPGRTGWSAQSPLGVALMSDRRKVEDVIEWLEDLLAQQPTVRDINPHVGRDEL